MIKTVLYGLFILTLLYLAGIYPSVAVLLTSISITLLFLIFGGS